MEQTNQPTARENLSVQEKSILALEFPRVIEMLSTHTRSPVSCELAYSLLPRFDTDQVLYLQRETLEANRILEFAQNFSLSRDPRPALLRSLKGGILSGEELIIVADGYSHVRQAKSLGSKLRTDTPLLYDLTRNIADFKAIEQKLRNCLSSHGELLDQATPRLSQLRFESRAAFKAAEKKLESMINSEQARTALQDDIVTLRSDRLVLPIKAEYKGQIPGIIHAVSDSGATLFVEPFTAVNSTNNWKEKHAAEQDEVQHILRNLTTEIARTASKCLAALNVAGRLDLALSKSRYAMTYQGVGLTEASGCIELLEARHPLLGSSAIPVSFRFSEQIMSIAITGPNTGGKTASLKTLGLLILMRQAGLMIPCDRNSRLPIVDGVFADIGDQQDLEKSISTFSSHLLSIKEIISSATSSSIVLLDELGSSTDPEEGSALAIAVLSHLVDVIGAFSVITTHHRSVASYVTEHKRIENSSVELNPATLEPTYKLTQGIPGRSYAIETAKRVGLPLQIINYALRFLSPVHQETEKLLLDIQNERFATRKKLEEAENQRIAAAHLEDELKRKIEQISKSEETLILETKKQLIEQVRAVTIKLKKASSFAEWLKLSGSRFDNDLIDDAFAELDQTKRALKSKKWLEKQPSAAYVIPEIKTGDFVQIEPLGFVGELREEPAEHGNTLVLVGSAKLKLHMSNLKLTEKKPLSNQKLVTSRGKDFYSGNSVETELDVRGMDSNEALEAFLGFLSHAITDGLVQIRVIHGKGSGTLRRILWEYLAQSELVDDYRFASRPQGGEGVTEITLPSSK